MATVTPPAATDPFDQWMSDRPKWLQTAAARLFAKSKAPNETELAALISLCLAEAQGDGSTQFERLPSNTFSSPLSTAPLRLVKIAEVKGVNALVQDATIELEQAELNVVYGGNGSGKSGFARLLKHACGCRMKEDLQSNIFMDNCPPPSAQFVLALNGVSGPPCSWALATGPLHQLQHFHIFDGPTASSYVNSKNEPAYEPRLVRFLGAVNEVVTRVSLELSKQKALLPSRLPSLPSNLEGSPTHTFLKGLQHSTTSTAILAATGFSEEEKTERLTLETSLGQTDIQGRIGVLNQRLIRLARLKKEFEDLAEAVADPKIKEILLARVGAARARKAAKEDADKVFSQSAFKGIGQESWQMLWNAAREFSEKMAYPGLSFPVVVDGGKCVLCHQALDDLAKTRLTSFESYIRGKLEAEAKAAEDILATLVQGLPEIPGEKDWELKAETIQLDALNSKMILASIGNRKRFAETSTDLATVPVVNWQPLTDLILQQYNQISKEIESLKALQIDGTRIQMASRLRDLKAKEWLSPQGNAIRQEVARLVKLKEIEKAEGLTKTQAITKKINEIAEEELANGYKNRFLAELKALGGTRIKVEPSSVPGGNRSGTFKKASFQLSIKGAKKTAPTQTILSEGECRIAALAAFIADMTGSAISTPFLFDDPISSLDNEFEERVAERLVALARDRQVIVLTHRLSLVNLLEEAKNTQNNFSSSSGASPLKLSIVTLARVGDQVGLVEGFDVRNKTPKAAFNFIKDTQLPMLRKHLAAREMDLLRTRTKAVCCDFRIVLENLIEKTLLCDILARHRREVHSQKLKDLSKILPSDCELIDDVMSRYCGFKHSQSEEYQVALPSPDEVNADSERILEWIKGFEKRSPHK